MSKRGKCVASIAIACSMGMLCAGAENPVTCSQTDEILTELRQLRALIEKQAGTPTTGRGAPSAVTTEIDVGSAPFLGSKDAAITIVEFTDFQCPFCNQFFVQTFPALKKDYIDSGKIRFYSMDLPLEMHPDSLLAAQAGRCAGEQGQFWIMHDRMQANPGHLQLPDLVTYAQEAGMDIARFRDCVDSAKYKKDVQDAASDAMRKGAQGTPAFVIGTSTKAGVEGEIVIGAQPYSFFDNKLRSLDR